MRLFPFVVILLFSSYLSAQNVGVGTTTPNSKALLHIDLNDNAEKGFLVSGTVKSDGGVPDLGPGSRMMFFPGKAAFRAGASPGNGWNNANVGFYSFAVGEGTIARGNFTTATGFRTHAGGEYSTAMGAVTVTKGYASTVVGLYNDSILLNSESIFSDYTPLFIVGNGGYDLVTGNAYRSNAFVVRRDGNVAIGNFQPEHKLDVGGRIRLRGTTADPNNTAGIWFNNIANTTTMGFMGVYNDNTIGFYGPGAFWGLTMNTSSGNVGIGTVTPSQKLSVIGNITATGTITSSSDIRFKTDIQPLPSPLKLLKKLNPITYHWKKDFTGYTDAEQLGFSAQEVEKFFPQLVLTDANGYKSVDYGRLTPVLVQAIKEQQQEIDDLKSRLEKLEKLLSKN